MNIEKKVISDLTLCYWVTTLEIHGKRHFLVASEKEYACLLFDQDGNLVDKVWDRPGGTMTAVQVPGAVDGDFLATHRMYAPDWSKDASIVLAYPAEDGWKIKNLVHLPGVHRFDILRRNGVNFLSADCLPVDCDNDHSEDPADWIKPSDVLEAFPGVSLAIHYSRFNNREKNGKPARPKFHAFLEIGPTSLARLSWDQRRLSPTTKYSSSPR